MTTKRTTHSDLAQLILDHVGKLEAVPVAYLVGDASTRELLTSAARILVEQDRRIERSNGALRLCRDALPTQERAAVNAVLGEK